MEDSKIDEDIESLTFKRKLDELSKKLDKAKNHNGCQGEKNTSKLQSQKKYGRSLAQ